LNVATFSLGGNCDRSRRTLLSSLTIPVAFIKY